MATQVEQISAAGDPVETIQVPLGADPALDPLQLSRRAAAPGTPVEVVVVVRNVGRGLADGLKINFYEGKPAAGVLRGSVDAPLPLDLNESYTARFTINAPTGSGDIYAEVVSSGANLSSANDRAAAQLSKPGAPQITALGEDQLFAGNVRLAWLQAAGEVVAGYRVYRGSTAGGPFEFIGEAGATTYVDLLSQPGVSYCYRVRAYSASNTLSDASVPLCGKVDTVQPGGRTIFLPLIRR
jgi:hypothetical protein